MGNKKVSFNTATELMPVPRNTSESGREVMDVLLIIAAWVLSNIAEGSYGEKHGEGAIRMIAVDRCRHEVTLAINVLHFTFSTDDYAGFVPTHGEDDLSI